MAKVWARFSKTMNGETVKFRIQTLEKEKYDKFLDVCFKYYVLEEPLHKASKFYENEKAVKELHDGYSQFAQADKYQVDACVLDNDTDLTIVGVSIITVEEKGKENKDREAMQAMIETPAMKKMLQLFDYMYNACNVLETCGEDKCYVGQGLVVTPDYRGLGIAGEMLKFRLQLCKERGIPMTSAWMTSIGTQKAAAKLGWKTICEIPYEKFGKETEVEFEKETPSCKLMIMKV